MIGDFNANLKTDSRFGKELLRFCNVHSLSISDKMLLPSDTFTIISSSHGTTSWLDHILTTTSGHSIIRDLFILTDFITSDHLPISFSIYIDNLLLHVPDPISVMAIQLLHITGMVPQKMTY